MHGQATTADLASSPGCGEAAPKASDLGEVRHAQGVGQLESLGEGLEDRRSQIPSFTPSAGEVTAGSPDASQKAATAAGGFLARLRRPDKDWSLLPERYRYKKVLGSGSYGVVCEAEDLENDGRKVAVKKISRVFDNIGDGKRILRELAILVQLQNRGSRRHSRIIRLLDVFAPCNLNWFEELYLVMEHQGQDLRALGNRKPLVLSDMDVKGLLQDLFLGLRELHAAGIFHRDLKPANCLARPKPEHKRREHGPTWDLCICDFGHSRVVGDEDKIVANQAHADSPSYGLPLSFSNTSLAAAGAEEAPPRLPCRLQRTLTCHVATRWYRAPELILLQGDYSAAVDIWSAGCICAELFHMLQGNAKREPLFPGRHCWPLSPEASPVTGLHQAEAQQCDQLATILKIVGSPDDDEVDETIRGPSDSALVRAARDYINSFPVEAPKDLHVLFPTSKDDALDLLGSLLRFSPQRRLTVHQALAHPFLEGLPPLDESEDEGTPRRVPPLDFESEDLTQERLRELLIREIHGFQSQHGLGSGTRAAA